MKDMVVIMDPPDHPSGIRLGESLRPMRALLKTIAQLSIILVTIALSSCGLNTVGEGSGSSPGPAVRISYQWPVSSPSAQGMDPLTIATGLRQIQDSPFILSVLIVRNDSLVLEYYAPGLVPENDFPSREISASILSALLGQAIDRGIIRSVQEKVLPYFQDFDTTQQDPRKQQWTIEHMITMRSGMDWNDAQDYLKYFTSGNNWLRTALGLPLRYSPGATFNYTTPNANIVAGLLARAEGISMFRFAQTNLFDPLQISIRSWDSDPQEYHLGGTGMHFTPRDLARFGQLYLHNGFLDGKQIVPREWIRQSLIPRNGSNMTKGDLTSLNFGYYWWTNYNSRDSIIIASGFGGQGIYLIPARNMIIVTIGDTGVTPQDASANELAIIGILRKYFF